MGGDHAPEAIVAGAKLAASQGVSIILVGDEEVLKPLVAEAAGVVIEHASEQVEMSDRAAEAFRRKPNSSLKKTLELVSEGRASAAVSCGHSGALVIAAVLLLRTVEGVERPAIATVLPRSDGGRLVLLDAGANVDCRPEVLAGFAALGVNYARVLGVEDPRVGVLANGREDGKGNALVQAALPLIREMPITVVGNVEPADALAGMCDVLVCDGFVGNILIKSAEAAVDTVLDLLRREIRKSTLARLGAALVTGALKRFRSHVAWDAHGGGILLGVNGVVVVGHGRANPEAVNAAIHVAFNAVEENLIVRVQQSVSKNGI